MAWSPLTDCEAVGPAIASPVRDYLHFKRTIELMPTMFTQLWALVLRND